MIRQFTILAGVAAAIGACANTSRFDGASAPRGSNVPFYQAPQASAGGLQTQPGGFPSSNAAVTASPLPAPGAASSGQAAAGPGSTLAGSVAAPVDPLFAPQPAPTTGTVVSAQTPQEPATLSGGGGRVATLGERSSGERTPAGRTGPVASRDGIIGGWTAREATGTTCKVQLSSSPALDLYRASASGCANKELQKVTAWDYRDGEVYLYQPGGAVAARMRANDGSSLSGSIARSGAGLTLSR